MPKNNKHPGVTIRPHGNGYQARWRERHNGVSIQEQAGFTTYGDAYDFAIKLSVRLQVARKGVSIAQDLVRPPGVLEKIVPEWISIKTHMGKHGSGHPRVLRTDMQRCMRIFSWKTTQDIGVEAVNNMIFHYHQRNNRVAAYKVLGTIKNLLKWCKGHYLIHDGVFAIKLKDPPPRKRVLWTEDETRRIYEALLNPPDPKDPALANVTRGSQGWREKLRRSRLLPSYKKFAAVFRLECLWGPRPKEVSQLTVSMWDTTTRSICISAEIAKNQSERTIPVDPTTASIIDDLCRDAKPNDLIFRTRNGAAWSTGSQWKLMHGLLKRLGISGTNYCGRHFATTRLVRDGRISNFKSVMAVTGHKTLSEFQKYVHGNLDEVKHVADHGHDGFLHGGPRRPAAAACPQVVVHLGNGCLDGMASDDHVVYDTVAMMSGETSTHRAKQLADPAGEASS